MKNRIARWAVFAGAASASSVAGCAADRVDTAEGVSESALSSTCQSVTMADGGNSSEWWAEYKLSPKPNSARLIVGSSTYELALQTFGKWTASTPNLAAGTSAVIQATYDNGTHSSKEFGLRQGTIVPNCDTAPPPSPAPPSQSALFVNFEKHAGGTSYNKSTQSLDWSVLWDTQMDGYASISADTAASGSKSLKVRYPSNQQTNTGAAWSIPSKKEYYLSYKVRFASNFDFDGNKYSGGKLPGLGNGSLCSGGATCNGSNGFSSRYMWRQGGKATLYLYHMDKPSTYGEDIDFVSNGVTQYFQKGKWHELTQRVRINDSGMKNGEIDVWMDKTLVVSKRNLRFVTNGAGVDTMYFSTFFGGSGADWWPSTDAYAYFDDFIASTTRSDVGL
jgi:hypothetical protein